MVVREVEGTNSACDTTIPKTYSGYDLMAELTIFTGNSDFKFPVCIIKVIECRCVYA